MAGYTNREITFIVKAQNQAKAVFAAMRGDLRAIAKEAGTFAAAQRAAAKEIDVVGDSAKRALVEVKKLRAEMAKGGTWGGGRGPPVPGAGGGGGGGRGGGGGHGPSNVPSNFFSEMEHGIKHMIGFTTALAAMELSVEGVKTYFEKVTDYQNLVGKVGLVTSAANQKAVQDKLFQVALGTHQDIESVGEAYYKGKGALGRFGYSDDQVIALSKVINQANLVSHASPQAAKYGTYELMQGIGAGTLNGRELRFVAQDSIRLAKALADGLTQTSPQLAAQFGHVVLSGARKGLKELTPGDLKEIAKKGELTGTAVANALLSQQAPLAAEAAKIPLTVPRVKNDVNTSLTKSLGEFDQKNGLSSGVVNALETLATTVIPSLATGLQPVADAIHIVVAGFQLLIGFGGGIASLIGQFLPLNDIVSGLATFLLSAGTAFGILATGAAAFSVVSGLVVDGIKAITLAMEANPFLIWAAAISAVIGLYEVFKDKTVEIGGETASVGSIISIYWQRTMQFVTTLFTDFFSVVQKVGAWIAGVWSDVCNAVVSGWNFAVNAIQKAVATVVAFIQDHFGPIIAFFGKVGGAVGNVLGKAFDGVAGKVKTTVAGAVGGVVDSRTIDAAKKAGGYLAKTFHGAFDGAMKAAAADTKKGAKSHQTYNLADLDKGDKELDPNGTEDEKKKRKRADPYEKIGEAVKSLSAVYAPWLEMQVRDGQDAAKVAELRKLQAQNTEKFTAALKASGLTLRDFNQLAYSVSTGLDDASVKTFFADYVIGWKDSSEAEKKAQQNARVSTELQKARNDALVKGTQAAKDYYAGLLAKDHVTDADVQQASLFQRLGISADQIGPSKIQELVKTALTAKEQIKLGVSAGEENSKTEDTARAAKLLLGVSEIQLLEIAQRAGVTIVALRQALANMAAGVNDKKVQETTAQVEKLVAAYSPYLAAQKQQADQLNDINVLQAALISGDETLKAALKEKGIAAADFARTLNLANAALTQQGDFIGSAKVAAADYVNGLKTNGVTFQKVWSDTFKGAEDALVKFIQTGKLDFASLIDSMLADLERLAAQKALTALLGSIPGVGSLTSLFTAHHAGGMVGSNTGWARSLSPSVFAGARRYHTGGLVGNDLRHGEVPIIAKQNEAVLPTTRLPDGNFGVRAIMPDQGRTSAGGNNVHFNPVLNISVQGGSDDPKNHAETISRSLLPALKQMVQDQLIDQMRPGGLIAQR